MRKLILPWAVLVLFALLAIVLFLVFQFFPFVVMPTEKYAECDVVRYEQNDKDAWLAIACRRRDGGDREHTVGDKATLLRYTAQQSSFKKIKNCRVSGWNYWRGGGNAVCGDQ